jgi:hypothetical protein
MFTWKRTRCAGSSARRRCIWRRAGLARSIDVAVGGRDLTCPVPARQRRPFSVRPAHPRRGWAPGFREYLEAAHRTASERAAPPSSPCVSHRCAHQVPLVWGCSDFWRCRSYRLSSSPLTGDDPGATPAWAATSGADARPGTIRSPSCETISLRISCLTNSLIG